MPVSSLILRAAPGKKDAVLAAAECLPKIDITQGEGESLVVVTDTKTRDEDKEIWKSLKAIPGVIGLDLIYHNFEDTEEF